MTKLTTKAIKAARYDEGDSSAKGWKRGQRRDVRWDDELSGFGLRVYTGPLERCPLAIEQGTP